MSDGAKDRARSAPGRSTYAGQSPVAQKIEFFLL